MAVASAAWAHVWLQHVVLLVCVALRRCHSHGGCVAAFPRMHLIESYIGLHAYLRCKDGARSARPMCITGGVGVVYRPWAVASLIVQLGRVHGGATKLQAPKNGQGQPGQTECCPQSGGPKTRSLQVERRVSQNVASRGGAREVG